MNRLIVRIECPTMDDCVSLARAIDKHTVGYFTSIVSDSSGNTGVHNYVAFEPESDAPGGK